MSDEVNTHKFMTDQELEARLANGDRLLAHGESGCDELLAILSGNGQSLPEWWAIWRLSPDSDDVWFDAAPEIVPDELRRLVSHTNNCVEIDWCVVESVAHLAPRDIPE